MIRRRLPIGMQTFRDLRERDCYYVDKTPYIRRLLDGGKHYFLSRPRRFGKSLFLDTLKELFEGNQELFEGLHIHDSHNWSVHHPVVRLSFGSGSFTETATLHEDISFQLEDLEEAAGIAPRDAGRRRACAVCCERCIGRRGSGWRYWWTSTTSRSWMRWWRRRRWRAPTGTFCAGCTG